MNSSSLHERTDTNTLRDSARDLVHVRNPCEKDRIGRFQRIPGVFTIKQNQIEGERSDSNDIIL